MRCTIFFGAPHKSSQNGIQDPDARFFLGRPAATSEWPFSGSGLACDQNPREIESRRQAGCQDTRAHGSSAPAEDGQDSKYKGSEEHTFYRKVE